MIYIPIIFIIVGIIVYFNNKNAGAIHANKCHYFTDLQFSAQEFYSLLEEIVKSREMPDVKISRVSYFERHILSNRREYLRIKRKDDIFDICAAPFGTGFFVSYWHGEPKKRLLEVALKTPFLGTVTEAWQGTTYFQIDTANMFKASVKDSITEAMDQITTAKGVRGLSEAERFAFHA